MQPIDPLPAWQSWHIGPEHPRWTEVLRDHSHVLIRPLRKDDREGERRFIESLSASAATAATPKAPTASLRSASSTIDSAQVIHSLWL